MQLVKGELQVRCNKWKAGWETGETRDNKEGQG